MVYIFLKLLVLQEYVYVDNFSNRNLFLAAKLLKQGNNIIKFEKHFLNCTTDTQI